MNLDDLARADLPALERLYREAPLSAPLPAGDFRGVTLARLDNTGAQNPLLRLVEWFGFELLPYGMQLDAPAWTFVRPSLRIGEFAATPGPSRWRKTDTFRLDYSRARLPRWLRAQLYDELKPLTADLLLGIGGVNAGPGEGDHFFYAMARRALGVVALGFATGLVACAGEPPVVVNAPPSPPSAVTAAAPPPPAASLPLPTPSAAAPALPPPIGADAGAADERGPGQPVAARGLVIHSAANPAYCIDAAQDRTAKRTPVRLFSCHGRENQRWTMSAGSAGSTAVAGVAGLCLDLHASHAADGTNAQLSPCNGGGTQQFSYDSGGRLRDVTSGKCLTVTKAARGAPILVEPCDPGNPGQVWSVADR